MTGQLAVRHSSNVLAVCVDALPKIGGVSLLAHHVSNALCDLGHNVTFLGPAGSIVPSQFRRAYRLCEDWESDTKKRAGKDAYSHDHRISGLVKAILRREKIGRIVMFHPFYYGTGVMDAANQAGIPVSVMFHGFELRSVLGSQGYPASLERLVKERRLSTLRERTFNTIGRAQEILANSSYTAGLFEQMNLTIPLTITGCGVEATMMRSEFEHQPHYDVPAKSAARAGVDLPDRPTIAYVGRLVPTKRVDRIIDIVAASANLQSVVIGHGPAEADLREQTQRLGVADRIHFAGQVSEVEKWALLRASDFLALLSGTDEKTGNVEGFGISLLEGATAACVPVTSGTGGMIDVVPEPDDNGIVLPLDADVAAQAAKLETLVADADRMRAIVDSARNQIQARYTWDRIAQRLADNWTAAEALIPAPA